MGAAAEKAIYLLADSMLGAMKDPAKQTKFQKLIVERRLSALLDSSEQNIKDAHKIIPYPIFRRISFTPDLPVRSNSSAKK